ncbi:PREDICTED: uncharacterized protein LOC105973857 [Erythranthe guttata]|uniref:uncharacterized protein LOC105973857 n=1 Tax=Erythranthe guttata TaxID=4155 RepID=UPI00064DC8F8|nr:PREDICTED: uncharacterized protein LOC105973857 [Erythranthe guttata]|eukprot:XP_012854361.1 PREDICTED: uncharacterized protein LOC105973857 [Erythranthe guttata]
MFEGKVPDPGTIIFLMNKMWNDLQTATTEVLSPNTRRIRKEVRWQPPEADLVKLNFDASVNAVDGVCGLGVIARSESGECIGWRTKCITQHLEPTAAEAKAALMAIEGDSSVVIAAVGESNCNADYGTIVSDIIRIGSTLTVFRAQHIVREGNKAAHEIARLSKNETYDTLVLPDSIRSIISADLAL